MPCPFFEPVEPVAHPAHPGARLPLIREYGGSCHASSQAVAAPEEVRFRCCNHGYSREECPHFPATEAISCMRYALRSHTSDALLILWIEEQNHTPIRWQEIRFDIASATVQGELPALVRAQVRAFSISYLNCTTVK